MKLYAAAVHVDGFHRTGNLYSRLTENEKWMRDNVDYFLESYHYLDKPSMVARVRRDNAKIFLDSGAFSAFTRGAEIDLPGYCRYVKEYSDIIEDVDGIKLFSVLDGIGDPLKTYRNQLEMERLGCRPLPCFHYGEDERYLEYYLANYEYITLGGLVPVSTPQMYLWLDRIWNDYLVDGTGRPRVRVHGFGITTLGVVERYPWFSVDSSSWVQIAGNGGIVLYPEGRVINVSRQSPKRKEDGQHIDTFPPIVKEKIEQRMVECGIDLFRIRETYLSRWAWNVFCFARLGELYSKTHESKFQREQVELFHA